MNHEEIRSTPPEPIPTETGRSMWKNFSDVIFEPSATFEDVGRRPKWVGPLIVILAATVVTSFLLMPLWTEAQRMGVMQRDMPEDQREQALRMMETFKWVGLAVAPIFATVITAIFALLLWAWGAISGAKNATFKVAFAALIYTGVIYILQSIAQAIVVYVKGAEQVALEGGQPTFGLALFMERGDMSKWLWGLIASVNFFAIWSAILVAIAGVHALKMSKGSAYAFAIFIWIVGALLLALQTPSPA
jgi:hypothetical protein